MIILVKERTEKTASNGNPYIEIKGENQNDQKEVTKAIFDNHKDKWDLIKTGYLIELVMKNTGKDDKGNNKWEIANVRVPGSGESTPPKPTQSSQEAHTEPMSKQDWADKDKATKESIERQVWIKELGLCIREKEIDITKPVGKSLRTYYYTMMTQALGIEIKDKEV